MKLLTQAASLALIGAGLAVTPTLTGGATAHPASPGDKQSLARQMSAGAHGSPQISRNKATGKISFIRVGRSGDLLPASKVGARGKADAFLAKYARAFGAPSSQLRQSGFKLDRFGSTVTYTQRYHGIPVFGSMLRAHFDRQGRLNAVNGTLVPVRSLALRTTLSAKAAAARAVRLVRAQPPSHDGRTARVAGLKAKSSTLVVYRHGLIQGRAHGTTELAYQVEVTNGKNIRDMVYVSAVGGKVVNRYSLMENALHRVLYEARLKPNGTIGFKRIWEEGDRYPGRMNTDQQNMIDSTGEAYWLFRNAFGRDSYDAAGHTMTVVNNDPRINCPNANWNGATTNYCDGVSSDDVVAHEWGHAYTEYTSGLIYQWQSGAMNEAYSDIWGETVDLINGRQDEGEGNIAAKRPDGVCSSHTPPNPLVTINSPAAIAKQCVTGGYMGPDPLTPVTADVVAPTDALDAGGTTTDGCSAYDQVVTGKIVLVDRGLCTFVAKAEVAKAAGAAALIIGNRDEAPVSFSSPDQTLPVTVSIGLTDRQSIRTSLAAGNTVNVSISDASGTRFDSYRWLMGEKSPAFGGAIRDMWSPTCMGDPGKVSDAEYKCSSDDSGGVHSNSGVVNHSYSLLVDGGTYNGATVRGLGLDKAANIYWKVQDEYLTPVSGFPDLADSLEAACDELVNKSIQKLSTQANDARVLNEKITADDCHQVALVTDAVELRVDPTDQCNWTPTLDPNAPPLCGTGSGTSVFAEDFEDGLAGWTPSGTNPFGGDNFPWEASTSAPGGHTGGVAFGPDPDVGDCSGTASDATSVDYLTSGNISVPATGTAKMSFDHYIATEAGFDGGNVQVSVDGGAFAPIPAAAYTFNAPGTLSTTAEGNTNPLAGQPGFTGTNPGSLFGSWGQSQVDLSQLNVAGKTIVLRLAMGRDGCTGVDGWYVDNVNVVTCPTPVTAGRTTSKPARRAGAGTR